MERLVKDLLPRQRIIFPLDVPTSDDAVAAAKLLSGHVGVFKIGLELFVRCGPEVIDSVKAAAPAAKIFLDLKLHDIPETVRRAALSASELGVEFLTVHCDTPDLAGSLADLHARTIVLGVTVLTSLTGADLKDMGLDKRFQDPSALVLHRAGIAKKAGLTGVVCSGLEVARVKQAFGEEFITVTPGIRLVGDEFVVASDDQKRVVTPYEAVRSGADYIVVGRPIRDAADPIAAATEVALDIERALS